MQTMAGSSGDDEYNLYGVPSIEVMKSKQQKNGTPLMCWGRAGFRMPRLTEIYVPGHAVTQPDPQQVMNPAFNMLREAAQEFESLSIYDATGVDNTIGECPVKYPEINNLNREFKVLSVEDEIFMSDSSESENNLQKKMNTNCDNLKSDYEKVPLEHQQNLNNTYTTTKDAAVVNWLQENDFEGNKPTIHESRGEGGSLLWNKENASRKADPRKKINRYEPNMAKLKGENPDLEGSNAVANYLLGKKSDLEEIIAQPKKKAKNKRKQQKNKTDPISLAELDMLVNKSDSEDQYNDTRFDELQLYYLQNDHMNNLQTESSSDFPELGPAYMKKAEKKKQPSPSKSKIDFSSLANSIIVPGTCVESKKPVSIKQNKVHSKSCKVLVIENLPLELSQENVQEFLEAYGTVLSISLSCVSNKLVASVIMDCDMYWIAESLHGNPISTDSGPVICYVEESNSKHM